MTLGIGLLVDDGDASTVLVAADAVRGASATEPFLVDRIAAEASATTLADIPSEIADLVVEASSTTTVASTLPPTTVARPTTTTTTVAAPGRVTATTAPPRTTTTTAPPRTTTTTTAPPRTTTTTAPPSTDTEYAYDDPRSTQVWYDLAGCEAHGNWALNTGNGYYGGLQFSKRTWESVGGSGYPHEHPASVQIEMGRHLQAREGWNAWPHCAAELGLSD